MQKQQLTTEEEEIRSKQIYDEDFANFLRQEKINKSTKQKIFCKKCGVELYGINKTGLCFSCYALTTRTVERPSREELKNLIRTLPFTKIATMFNVTDNAIRKWCDADNLPRRVSDIKSYSDSEWENI